MPRGQSPANRPSYPVPVPSGTYATRLSTRLDFLGRFLPVPEPGSLALTGAGLAGLGIALRGRRRVRGA